MRRLLRYLIRTLLVLVGLLVLLFLLRKPLFGEWLRGRIERELSAALGAPVTLGGIDGDWVTSFALEDLQMRDAPPHGPLTGLAVRRAEARFSLLGLLGDDPVAGVESIEVAGASVTLDLTRPPAPPSPETGEPVDPLALLPDSLPAIAVSGDVAVRWPEGEASALLALEGGGRELVLRAREIEAPHVGRRETTVTLRRTGAASFTLETDAEILGVGIDRARAAREDGRWGGELALRAGGGVVEARGDEARATAAVRDVDLAGLRPLLSALGREPAAGAVDGEASWTAPATVAASLRMRNLRVEGYEADLVEAEARWEDGRITVKTASVARGEASARVRDVVVDPALAWKVERLGAAVFRIPDVATFGPKLPQPVSVVGEVASEDGRTLAIRALTVKAGESRLELDGRAVLPPAPARWREASAELTVKGVLDGWSAWAPDAPSVAGAVAVEGSLRGTVAAPRGTLTLRGGPLVVDGRALDRAVLEGELAWPKLESFRAEAEAGADRLVLRGAADLSRRTLREGSYEVLVARIGKWVEGARGSVDGSGRISWDGAALAGGGRLAVTGFGFRDQDVGDLSVAFRAAGDVVTVEELKAGPVTARGRFDLAAREGVVTEASGPEWRLLAPVSVRADAGALAVEGLRAEVYGGEVAGSGRRDADGRVAANLRADGVDLARVDGRLRGRAGGTVSVAGERIEVDLRAPDLGFREYAGRAVLKARQDATGIVLEELDAVVGESLVARGSASVPWRYADGAWVATGRRPAVDLTVRCAEPLRWLGIEAARADARIRGDGPLLSVQASVVDWIPHPELAFRGESKVTAEVGTKKASLSAATPPLSGTLVRADVALDRGLAWAEPDAWRAAWSEATVEGALDVSLPDLSVVRPLLPGLRYLAGRGSIRARVTGPLKRPAVDGSATLSDLAATLPDPLPPFQRGSARFVFDRDAVRCESLSGELGYAPVRLSGRADRERIEMNLAGENVLVARSRHLRARADLDIALEGAWDALSATGRVDLTDVLYSNPINLFAGGRAFADDAVQLFSLREEPFASMKLDVGVRADETVLVRNNVIRGAIGVDLRILGTGAVPEPRGRVTFRDTLVKLEFSSLKVDRGQLEFRPENPFAPRLDAVAHTRMRGHDIQVRVVGEVPEFEVQTSASPYLPPDDILLLLTVGLTRAQLEGEGASGRVLQKAALLVGQRLYRRARGPTDPDERSVLDRFEFDMGRDISRSGEETIEAEFELTKRYYLRGERDRFDDYNLGFVWRLRFR